jgi:hypothetical protein
MMLPLIRTLDGAESAGWVPSKIRTFSMTVTAERSCASADTTQIEAAAAAPPTSQRKVRRLGVIMIPPRLVRSLSANIAPDFGCGTRCCSKPVLQANDALVFGSMKETCFDYCTNNVDPDSSLCILGGWKSQEISAVRTEIRRRLSWATHESFAEKNPIIFPLF